jgi:GNAT superfamily N-acetyltransferase
VDLDALLAAGDRNLATVLRVGARTAPDGVLEDDGRLLLVSLNRTWPAPYTNGAFRLDRSLPPGEVLARARDFFAGRSSGYCVWVAAHADADLEAAALENGLAQITPTGAPRMALDHRLPPAVAPPGITLEEVADEAGRLAYLAVTLEAYAETPNPPDALEAQMSTLEAVAGPEVRAVVAHSEGRPVAAAMVVNSDLVAGIQFVGTVPDARGRGLGELCTRWAANAGWDMGASAIVLEASDAGEPLYRQMGFVEVSRYRWCFGPPRAG